MKMNNNILLIELVIILSFISICGTNTEGQNLDSLFSNSTKTGCCFFFSFTDPKKDILYPLKCDIYDYFNLETEYNTPLKLKKFYETPEGINLTDSLLNIKKDVLSKWWKVYIGFDGRYDIDEGMFYIFDIPHCYDETILNYIPDICGIYFPKLKIFLKFYAEDNPPGISLKFHTDENSALYLENNLENIEFYLLFKVKNDLFKKSLEGKNSSKWVELPIAYDVKLVVYDKKESKIILSLDTK
jgi:hypothetical protein